MVITPLRDAGGSPAGFAKITRDLTDRREAEQSRMAREMSSRILAAQEEERRHIARELHDETGQALTIVRVHMSEFAARSGADGARAAEGVQYTDRAIAHIRSLALRLRPPMLDDLGLADALDWLAEQQAEAAGWRLAVDLQPQPEEERLPEAIETACFRICQEALTNAARSSGATEVRVALRVDREQVELEVTDNGDGFDLDRDSSLEERKKHFGLVFMAERAALVGGTLVIATVPGRGTTVRATIPLRWQDGMSEPAQERALSTG